MLYKSKKGYVIQENDLLIGIYNRTTNFDGIIAKDTNRFEINYKTGWLDHTDSIGRRDCGYFDNYIGKQNALKIAIRIIQSYGKE